MAESFPTTPHARAATRVTALLIGLAAIAVATRTTITSREWIGRPFPGFVLIDNRVIASIGLAHWSGTAVPELYQSEVVAVEGQVVQSTADIYARVRSAPPGVLLHYHLLRGGHERDVEIATQPFMLRDWLLLFGTFLLNGGTYLAAGLVVWLLRPRAPLGQALLVLGTSWAFFLLTAMDLYGPATFFRMHVICEALMPPAVLQFALLFPQPHRFAGWRFAGYLPALAIGALYERFLYLPWAYSAILYANMTYLGLVGVFFGVRLVWEYWQGGSPLARQRVGMVTLGTLCGFAIPGAIVLMSVFTGGGFAMNAGAFTQVLFCLSLAYAVMKHDLFEIDAMVKRGAYYLVLSGAVAAAYIGAVVLLNVMLNGNTLTASPAFPVLFTFAVLLVFDPLRTRLQAFVDRVFFRTAYDGARELAAVGGQLASALQRERIVALVRAAVEHAIPNTVTCLFVREPDGRLAETGDGRGVPPALGRALDEGRVITVYDPAELYPDAATHEAVRAALTTLGAQVALPLRLRGGAPVGPEALRAARNAGIFVPKSTVELCTKYVKSCQNADGGFMYQKLTNTQSIWPRTAAGLVALYSAGIYEGKEVEQGLKFLMNHMPRGELFRLEAFYFYGHYYAVQAMWHAGGQYWREWYPAIRDSLVGRQSDDGSWSDSICVEYGTAMAVIILQMPNNYLPIFQR